MCIHDCELKTRIQEERCIKSRQTDKLRQTSHQSNTTRHTCPHTLHRNKENKSNSKSLNADKNPQRTTTRNSLAESPILLWREIPMAWGTTTDSLTPEINPFQYARETKHLTPKNLDTYLITDG